MPKNRPGHKRKRAAVFQPSSFQEILLVALRRLPATHLPFLRREEFISTTQTTIPGWCQHHHHCNFFWDAGSRNSATMSMPALPLDLNKVVAIQDSNWTGIWIYPPFPVSQWQLKGFRPGFCEPKNVMSSWWWLLLGGTAADTKYIWVNQDFFANSD